jgi:electron transfer flavoprotein beta subunit
MVNVIVLAKQVPDTQNISGELMTAQGTINRDAMPAIFNPDDLFALEAALQIKDAYPDTTVNVISMGPPAAAAVLKECLYRGADFTALVSDRALAGADTQATSYTLACAIKKTGAFDLILCGRQAIDGETAQVGPQIAEKLGINQITCVSKIESVDTGRKEITAIHSIDGGKEKLKAAMPLLLSFTSEGEALRPASIKKALSYKDVATSADNKPLALWNIAAINAEGQKCGSAGSPTMVKSLDSVIPAAADITYIDASETGIAGLIQRLSEDRAL